jgi:hypothetical protein
MNYTYTITVKLSVVDRARIAYNRVLFGLDEPSTAMVIKYSESQNK